MTSNERGSEIVQAVVAVPLVLVVVFSIIQVGAMMLSVNRLTADMVMACRQMDTAGLALALDKEAFVKEEILGAATQLEPESLHVTQVLVAFREDEVFSQLSSVAGVLPKDESSLVVKRGGTSSLSQRTQIAEISFNVVYNLPFLAEVPGLARTTITRHIECSRASNRIVEVEVAAL